MVSIHSLNVDRMESGQPMVCEHCGYEDFSVLLHEILDEDEFIMYSVFECRECFKELWDSDKS